MSRMRKRRKVTSKVTVTFTKAKPPVVKGVPGRLYEDKKFQTTEQSLEYLWMEHIPEGMTPLDWFRAWNEGYPTEEDVEIYNLYHPDEPMELEEE
jgi:hypothetical protein